MYVGFDIGGTSIKYGVLDETGAILEKSAIPTSYEPAQFYQDGGCPFWKIPAYGLHNPHQDFQYTALTPQSGNCDH